MIGLVIKQPLANQVLRGETVELEESKMPKYLDKEFYIINGGYVHGTSRITKVTLDSVRGFIWHLVKAKRIKPIKCNIPKGKWTDDVELLV